MQITRRTFALTAASLMALSPLGCANVAENRQPGEKSFLQRMPLIGNKSKEEVPEPYPNPVKLATAWTPDTLAQVGRTPTRGFGGRVFFYDEKSRPVPVEGTLVVHGFDDSGDQASSAKRFEFTPEQFTRHFSQSDLGASYSVWIPWDAMGGDQRRISLMTSFRTKEGKAIQGVPTTIMLPGNSTDLSEEDEFARMSPQYQKYREATDTPAPSSGLTTTTIARRNPSRSASSTRTEPGITIPPRIGNNANVATGSGTPAVDIQRFQHTSQPDVMPASASMPFGR